MLGRMLILYFRHTIAYGNTLELSKYLIHGSWHNYSANLVTENTLAVVSLAIPISIKNRNRKQTLEEIIKQNGILLATSLRKNIYIDNYIL